MCLLRSDSAATLSPPPARAQSPALSPALWLTVILTAAVYVRSLVWWTSPPDMAIFLEPWFNHIVRYGPVGAFAHPFSNYEPAYLYLLALGTLAKGLLAPMYIIKLLSVAGTVFLALAVADLLRAMGTSARGAVLVMLMPAMIINDALLGQCDALWGGCCVLALAAMIRGHTIRSLVWCGIAIGFKLQAAFIAPVIIGAMIGRRPPLWQWAVPPLVFVGSLVPAWLAGWPAWKLIMVYPSQPAQVFFAGRLGNPWMAATLFADLPSRAYYPVGYAAAVAAAVAIAALAAASFRDRRLMLLLGLLSATALPFLLPKMLERYYFLGDVLALALALSFRTRTATWTAIAVQTASLLSLLTYVFWYRLGYPALLGGVFAAAALAGICVLLRQCGARWPSFARHASGPVEAEAVNGEAAVPPPPASDARIAA